MNTFLLYSIQCAKCPQKIELLGTNLEKIIRGRRVSDTGDPFVVLVCSPCRAATQYDSGKLPALGVMEETSNQKHPSVYTVVAGCGDNNCNSLVELVAIRNAGTTHEQFLTEIPTWKLEGILCRNGHALVLPEPERFS